jgi:peptidoglycan/LPS O-acetylase OafA/YrhL
MSSVIVKNSDQAAQGSAGLQGHIPSLDGLRGLAILLVLAHHLRVMGRETIVDYWFVRAVGFGWCGVDLFFVLSGFLITGILLDSKGRHHYLRNFYGRRVLRILPLYYAVVFLSLVILPALNHPKITNFGRISGDEIWYWLHLCNFSIARAEMWRHGILDVCWSLAIEEQFYLVWPFVVLFLNRRWLIWACLLTIATALAFRVTLRLHGAAPIAIYVWPFCRMDALATGALIAVLARQQAAGVAGLLPIARVVAVISGATLLVLWATGENYQSVAFSTQTFGYSLLAVFFGAVLILAACVPNQGWFGRCLHSRFMRAFGKYSYALYLFHLPLRAVVRDTVYGRHQLLTAWGSQIPGQLLFYVIGITLAYAAAWLSWELYESHWLKLKKYFAYEATIPEPRSDY